jgi:hypothetical protein
VFWSDEDQCWVADAPDLRFCSAHGENPGAGCRGTRNRHVGLAGDRDREGVPIPEARYQPPLAG